MLTALALAAALSADIESPRNIVDVYNLLFRGGSPRQIVSDGNGWRYQPKGDNCFASHSASYTLTVDMKNAFVAIDSVTGPDCEEPSRRELAAFKRADGRFVWLFSERNIYVSYVVAQELVSGQLSEAPGVVASLPTARDIVPSELIADETRVQSAIKAASEGVEYVLPQEGTTVVARLAAHFVARICDAFVRPPETCQAHKRAKLKLSLSAKWDKKTGHFLWRALPRTGVGVRSLVD